MTTHAIWLRAQQTRDIENETLRQATIKKLDRVLGCLYSQYGWKEIYLFGSVMIPGNFHQKSDIDMGVRGLNPDWLYRFIAELSNLMEREVDVVMLENSRLAATIRKKGVQWPFENP